MKQSETVMIQSAVCAHERASKASVRVTGRQIDWMAIYTERTREIDRTSKRESV